MTGSTATIVSVGKPLPESLVGQQVRIERFVAPTFPVVKLADGREYIMDISRLNLSEVEHPELCGWQGKRYFSASELIKLPGMPEKVSELCSLAQQQGWKTSPYAGEPQYYFGEFPDETKTYFLAKWFRACEKGDSGIRLSEEQILEKTCNKCGQPHLDRFTQTEGDRICFRCQPQQETSTSTLSKIWLETKMRHFERIIPKLAKNPNHYRLVQGLQAEYEQVLATLGINDEEVEF